MEGYAWLGRYSGESRCGERIVGKKKNGLDAKSLNKRITRCYENVKAQKYTVYNGNRGGEKYIVYNGAARED